LTQKFSPGYGPKGILIYHATPPIFEHTHTIKVSQQALPSQVLSGGSRKLGRGFSHWRTKRTRKFLSCHAHFRSR